jgi:hypothetical protein
VAVRLWCQYILENLPDDLSGPWRIPGDVQAVQKMKEHVDNSGEIIPANGTHVTVVTSMVAEYLKELPGAIFNNNQVDQCLAAGGDMAALKQMIQGMSPARSCILGCLLQHWHLVAKDKRNLMTPKAIGKACFLFLVDSKQEFARIGMMQLLKLESSITALIEHVIPSEPWPNFSETTQFGDLPGAFVKLTPAEREEHETRHHQARKSSQITVPVPSQAPAAKQSSDRRDRQPIETRGDTGCCVMQ